MRGTLASTLEDLRAANAELNKQNRLFDAALDNMSQGLCMFDRESRLLVVNRRYLEMFGLERDELPVGITQRELIDVLIARRRYSDHLTADMLCEGTRASLASSDAIAPVHRELSDGRVIAALHRPMPGGGWVATFEDVTDRIRNEAQIARMARHDALTDLPNRTALREHRPPAEGDGSFALLYLDLDRFKYVNDTHGHSIGDALLQAVADRLRETVTPGDLVARLGGDEFAIVHRVSLEAQAMALAERLISTVSAPYQIGAARVEVGLSIGIAMADRAAEDLDRVLQSADLALYRAKSVGRGTACLFEAAMDEYAQQRRTLEKELREAVAGSDFELHFQPLVDVASLDVVGFESLLRWRHPVRGLIGPVGFISAAEETGLIVPMGEWVLKEACRAAAGWPAHISVAVNVSAVQLRHSGFVQSVLVALTSSGLRPDRLELEITESVLLEDVEGSIEILHLLRRAGIRIAMDDFGTGYSSLSYLRRFPFDKIKLDRSFMRDAPESQDALAIIRAIVGLGADLGIRTLVEGIETAEQLAVARAEGVQQAQGFLLGRPKPLAELAGYMEHRQMRSAAA